MVHRALAFVVLGAVVLCVTGAEALYADMGHFGAHPIRVSWTFFVLPALVLNYFGQGALIISDPTALDNPFFLSGPHWVRLPLVALAAWQPHRQPGGDFRRLLDGAAMHAARLPPAHDGPPTSSREEGQIYVPQIT